MQESVFRPYLDAVLDLVFPRLCAVCEEALPEDEPGTVCAACWRGVERVEPPLCPTCGQPLRDPPAGLARCVACPQGGVHFSQARSAVLYAGPVIAAVHDLKFGYHSANHVPLAALLADGYRRFFAHLEFDAAAPVPLHPAREREREFNQSALLAQALCRTAGLRYAELLERVRNTVPQSRLAGIARLDNIRGAFGVPRPAAVAGRRVLLVDDVYTSGSTVNECARTLREAGAADVQVLTVARAR